MSTTTIPLARNEFERLANNYRRIEQMDLSAQPSKLATRGYHLREKMARGIRRIQRAGGAADASAGGDLGALPFIPLVIAGAASGMTWLATKLGDESDAYLADTTVVQQLIDAGVTPEKAADIVTGRRNAGAFKTFLYGAGAGAALLFGIQLWLKARKKGA